jgi:hypothetical protein
MRQTATTLGAFRSTDIATIPIASDVLTITSAYTIAQAQSGTADDIATITPNLNGISDTDSYFVMIEADAGDTITLKDGTGNLTLKGAVDIALTGGQRALLFGSAADGFTDFAVSSSGGAVDASDVTYTPTTLADWTGSADPGDVDNALDQLAERVGDLEGVGASLPVDDTTSLVQDPVDNTKQMRIDVGSVGAGQVRVLSMPNANVFLLQNNYTAIAAPTTGDDNAAGYAIGSIWIDIITDTIYVCADAGTGAAVWREVVGLTQTQNLTNKTLTTPTIASFANATHNHANAAGGGTIDASVVTYTPTTATDWDSDTDPGDVDNALDQLAERVDDLEGAGGGGITKVYGSGTHTPGANITTNSTSFVDVSASVQEVLTLNGGGVVIATVTMDINKVTAGNMFFRWTDGTNHTDEVGFRFLTAHDYSVTVVGIFDGLAAGSTTFKLQFRSSDANNVQIIANLPIAWHVVEIS